MFNICPNCGENHADKAIVPGKEGEKAIAICINCGFRHKFLQLPLFILTGASGAGKSTTCLALASKMKDVVVMESDILWRKELEQSGADLHTYNETWLRVCKNISQSGKSVVMCGGGTPDRIEVCVERRYFLETYYLALICDDEILASRLQNRPAWRGFTNEYIKEHISYNRWFINNAQKTKPPITLLDTSRITVNESVEEVARWIRSNLKMKITYNPTMTFPTHLVPQSDPPLPARETLPTMYDLPSENPEEPGLPDDFHFLQPLLLYLTFQPTNWNPELVYSAADLNLYYDIQHPQWYKRPDWFGVVGVSKLYEGRDLRLSYVTWQERANPFVVVELLSPGTEAEDLGETESEPNKPPTKWEVYERILRVPYYIVFSRYTNKIQAFRLVGGHYESMNFIDGRLGIPELGLSLGLWQGSFRDIERLWLRWFTLEGQLILVPEEEAIAATKRATIAEQEAAEARRRAERLADRLRQLGVNPDKLD